MEFLMKSIYLPLAAALAFAATLAVGADALYVDAKAVAQAQKTLNERGFKTGGVDGRMGPQTQAALVNFQRAEKLPPTGKLDRQTLMKLGLQNADGTASAGQTRYGPATIRKVQETLNARGYKAGPPNGVLGESTRTALRAFQKSENFKITGRPNPRTLAALGVDQTSASAGSSRR
jgi:peptidoglycan hydrolase-like protein with peptidoglycan-binding domain